MLIYTYLTFKIMHIKAQTSRFAYCYHFFFFAYQLAYMKENGDASNAKIFKFSLGNKDQILEHRGC